MRIRGGVLGRGAVAALSAAILLGTLAGCARGPEIPRNELNVLLITLDTTRQDHLGCYGNPKDLTPNLDRLAREGVLLEEAIATAPLTLASHASMMTGLYPFHHGVRTNGWFRLVDEHTTLAEILREEGFATGAVLAAYVLDRQFQLDQGFDFYDDDLSEGFQETAFSIIERRAGAVTESATRWLEEHRDRRFFLWVHYYDPHSPYIPPPEFDRYGTSDSLRYGGEVAYMDDNVGQILDVLKRLGLYDNTAIIAAGDHGEAFGEHGEYGHALLIYNTTLLAPFIVRLPNIEGLSIRRNSRVRGRLSLVDLAPTVLDLLGLEFPYPVDGRSLLPCLEGKAKNPDRPIYAETAQGKLSRGWSQLSCIYSGDWKYILAPTPELYDLSADAQEERNLLGANPSQAGNMKAQLVAMVSSPCLTAGSSPVFTMDSDTAERLRSLGYISDSSPSEEDIQQLETALIEACQTGRDPKDMMAYNYLIATARTALSENRPTIAIHSLKRARGLEGETLHVLASMASAYTQLKLFDTAVETYRKILELHPHERGLRNNLALVYHSKGESAEAIRILEELVSGPVQYYEYYLNLANVYDDLRRFNLADRSYRKALELAPTAAGRREEVRFNMALSFYRRGRMVEARDLLGTVLEERPDYDDARRLLGRVESRLASGQS